MHEVKSILEGNFFAFLPSGFTVTAQLDVRHVKNLGYFKGKEGISLINKQQSIKNLNEVSKH